MNILFLVLLSILVFCFFSCGSPRDADDRVSNADSSAPRVRLVKDTESMFHFQWNEPLKEERIILVRIRHLSKIDACSYSNLGD